MKNESYLCSEEIFKLAEQVKEWDIGRSYRPDGFLREKFYIGRIDNLKVKLIDDGWGLFSLGYIIRILNQEEDEIGVVTSVFSQKETRKKLKELYRQVENKFHEKEENAKVVSEIEAEKRKLEGITYARSLLDKLK